MQQPSKRYDLRGEVDASVCELECVLDLLEAVHTAAETGDMPQRVCANALFGALMPLRRVCADLRAECDRAFEEQSEPP